LKKNSTQLIYSKKHLFVHSSLLWWDKFLFYFYKTRILAKSITANFYQSLPYYSFLQLNFLWFYSWDLAVTQYLPDKKNHIPPIGGSYSKWTMDRESGTILLVPRPLLFWLILHCLTITQNEAQYTPDNDYFTCLPFIKTRLNSSWIDFDHNHCIKPRTSQQI
jgi:hypothetical protein